MTESSLNVRRVSVGLLGTNCYLLSLPERDDCLVIDPGAEPEKIREAAGDRRIAAILLTHGHFDHIGAVDALMTPETRLLVHEADAPMLKDPELNVCWMLEQTIICESTPELLREGDTVEAAGISLKVLHTPGHTPGGVCYEGPGVLFTGDTLFDNGYGRTDLPGGSMTELRQSLRRLMPYRETHRIYGGHG